MRAELLPPLPPGRPDGAADRHVNLSSRLPLRAARHGRVTRWAPPPVVMFFALGDRSHRILAGLRDWMGQHNAVIMAVICLIIGPS